MFVFIKILFIVNLHCPKTHHGPYWSSFEHFNYTERKEQRSEGKDMVRETTVGRT